MSADSAFWENVVSLLLSLVCLIEKEKLQRDPTTAELRKAGKQVLRECGKKPDSE